MFGEQTMFILWVTTLETLGWSFSPIPLLSGLRSLDSFHEPGKAILTHVHQFIFLKLKPSPSQVA